MDIVGVVTKAAKGYLSGSHSIDNWTFKLFYKGTVLLTAFFSVLVTSRQFFGNPIYCDAGSAANFVNNDVLESYCWMYAHFKIPEQYQGPCAGTDMQDAYGNSIEGPIYNSYYQWVSIYLIFLAVLFYMPRCMWLMMEGGLMKLFCKGTTTRFIEDPEEKRDKLVKFFKDNIHNKYNIYYFGFIFCECLNLVVALLSFALTHRFLNYRFATYGIKVWSYYSLPAEEQRLAKNPMCYVFPRIAGCDYHRFGGGGHQSNVNAICILSLNIINDKVFLVVWWWFILLILLAFHRILFRLVQSNSAWLRFCMLNLRMHRYFRNKENTVKIKDYVHRCSRGDWFVLYQLSKNLNRPFFMEFLLLLARTTDPTDGVDPNDHGDGIMDLMLKPTLATYESQDEVKGGKSKKDDDDEEDD